MQDRGKRGSPPEAERRGSGLPSGRSSAGCRPGTPRGWGAAWGGGVPVGLRGAGPSRRGWAAAQPGAVLGLAGGVGGAGRGESGGQGREGGDSARGCDTRQLLSRPVVLLLQLSAAGTPGPGGKGWRMRGCARVGGGGEGRHYQSCHRRRSRGTSWPYRVSGGEETLIPVLGEGVRGTLLRVCGAGEAGSGARRCPLQRACTQGSPPVKRLVFSVARTPLRLTPYQADAGKCAGSFELSAVSVPLLILEVLCGLLAHLTLWLDLNSCIPLFYVFPSVNFPSGPRLTSYRFPPSSLLPGAEKMASPGAPGTRMTSTVSINISTPSFYNPQKKFAPVVAPKPKVNPFKAGGASESSVPPPPGAGAQRAQMGKAGEIPSTSVSLPAEGR